MSEPAGAEIMATLRDACARLSESGHNDTSTHAIVAAYDQVVAERDAAVRERDMWQRRALSRIALQAENDELRARLATATRVTDEMVEVMSRHVYQYALTQQADIRAGLTAALEVPRD